MDNSNANNGGFSPNPNSFPGQFGSYDPNMGQAANSDPYNQYLQTPPAQPVNPMMAQAPMNNQFPQAQGMPMPQYPMQQNPNPQFPMPQTSAEPPAEMPSKSFEDPKNFANNPVVIAPDAPATREGAKEEQSEEKPKPFQRNLVNVQTKSMIESPRDASDEELAKAKAYEDAIIRQQNQEKMKIKAERGGAYLGLAIFGAIVLVVAGFLIINVFTSAGNGGGKNIRDREKDKDKQYSVIDGYQCKTEKCERMNDLPDGRILIRDTKYYIYNKNDSSTTLTTIDDEHDYRSIESFKWGDKIFAVVDPESGKDALYDVTANRMVTEYLYDEFMTDINDQTIYKEMAWVTSKYIVAHNKNPEQYALISLETGKPVVRGQKYVFVHDGYFFGYESDGEIRAYTSGAGSAYASAKSADAFFIRNGYLLSVTEGGYNVLFYNTGGEVVNDEIIYTYYDEFYSLGFEGIIGKLNNMPAYYRIPSARPSN